jgi:hypothetical protein
LRQPAFSNEKGRIIPDLLAHPLDEASGCCLAAEAEGKAEGKRERDTTPVKSGWMKSLAT